MNTLQVDESEVSRMHTEYYEQVAALFHRHQPTFKGYEKVKLVMIL